VLGESASAWNRLKMWWKDPFPIKGSWNVKVDVIEVSVRRSLLQQKSNKDFLT